MSRQGIEHFVDEVNRVVDYFRKEYQMKLAEVVGALMLVAFHLAHGQSHDDDDDTSRQDFQASDG